MRTAWASAFGSIAPIIGPAWGGRRYAVVPAGCAIPLPDDASFAVGAGLGVPALTAHAAVFAGGPVKGLNVLVQGGAGAVAAYAIQFARHGGGGFSPR